MGQTESTAAANDDISRDKSEDSQPPSMDSLIAEALAYGDDENESLDAKAQKALECPCIADLRAGPCGTQFSDAFICFLKSTAEEKGSDCVNPFVMLQKCIKAHPDAFSKDMLEEEEEVKKEEAAVNRRDLPKWSWETKEANSKL